jgi:proteasome activator subunit 4
MDANDPPKTIATMQLIGSIFSNVSLVFYLFFCNAGLW